LFIVEALERTRSFRRNYLTDLEKYLVSEQIVHVTDDSFEAEVLQSGEPVLVDYWAEWCGPCKMIAPVLDEIAGKYSGRVKIAKLNIDDNPNTPPRYGIRGIPTLMLFKDGEVEATKVGAVSLSQLTAFIDSNI
jgi:thioredoxin 1